MKKMAVILTLFFLPHLAAASDEMPESSPTPTDKRVEQAMAEAEQDYATPGAASALERSGTSRDLSALVSQLAATRKGEERSVLTDLAKQVDELRNRLVLERATLLATQTPRNVTVQGARTVFKYRENSVYQISSAVDYVTDIQLKPGENITSTPTAGDTVRWNIAVMESKAGSNKVTHIIIKPTEPDIKTNLIIATDQHVYHLSLRTSDTHMPAAYWVYPEDNEARLKAALHQQETSEATITPERLRFDYELSGDNVSWKPIRVFDDGAKTFLQMPRDMRVSEAPVLFVLEPGEDPLLVNYRVEGDYYILDRLFTKAELLVGTQKKVVIELDDRKSFFERLF